MLTTENKSQGIEIYRLVILAMKNNYQNEQVLKY